jgi:hypothetical protein
MLLREMWNEARKIYEENNDEYEYIGVRFENKERTIGETCECSKNNSNREDERDFPEFDSEEYSELESFDGTSSWDLSKNETYKVDKYFAEKECSRAFMQDHCYIIAGNGNSNVDDGLDDNEVVIVDAKVIARLF